MLSPTPEITPTIADFCRSISDAKPIVLPVVAGKGDRPLECFWNVQRRIESEGGAEVLGWAIRAWPRVFAEAEHHAVWQRPDGKLVDVTPTKGEQRRLFLPDAKATYNAAQHFARPNKYQTLTDDPDITAFIEAKKKWLAIKMGDYGDVQQAAALTFQRLDVLLDRYLRPNDLCPCESGRKYKHCCAKNRNSPFWRK